MQFPNNIWNSYRICYTALIYAAQHGFRDVVRTLLENEEIDVNAKDIFLLFCEYLLTI